MWRKRVTPCLFLVAWMLAGCATPYLQGRSALLAGRYDAAADHFQEALARDPERFDALLGLGISRYKLGSLDESLDALRRAVAQAPGNAEARLYLGLGYLRKGEDGPAEEELTALTALRPHPRVVTQIARALGLLRLEPPSDELRGFLAASLEDQAAWARELREAKLAQQECELHRRPFTRPVPLILLRIR